MPGAFLSITESMVMTGLGDFLTAVLPAGVIIVQGQDNKVAEPSSGGFPDGTDYAVMWPTLRERLETNTDDYADITLEGSIAGPTLMVTSIEGGTLQAGQAIFGVGMTSGTLITAQTGGTAGGAGTYTVTPPQTIAARAMAAGLRNSLSPMKLTVQVDIHGPNSTDNTQIVATLFRDEYATLFFDALDPPLAPLYVDDGRQIPFVSGENQYEDRWVLMMKLQLNPVVSTSQQFADTLTVGIEEIDTYFPPGA